MSNKELEFAIANNARDAHELASFLKHCAPERWPQLIEKLKVTRPELFLKEKQ